MNKIQEIPIAESVEIPAWVNGMKVVDVREMKVNVLLGRLRNGCKIQITKVTDTPHYAFIKLYHATHDRELSAQQSGYEAYALKYVEGDDPVSRFVDLYNSIVNIGYINNEYKFLLIMLFRQRPWKPVTIFDGLHRAAVLTAIGAETVHVATLHPSRSLLRRLAARLCTVFN